MPNLARETSDCKYAIGVFLVIFEGHCRGNLYFFSRNNVDGLAILGHCAASSGQKRCTGWLSLATSTFMPAYSRWCSRYFSPPDFSVSLASVHRYSSFRLPCFLGSAGLLVFGTLGAAHRTERVRPGAALFPGQVHHRIALPSAVRPDQVTGQMVHRYCDLAPGRRSGGRDGSDLCHHSASAGPANQLDCARAGEWMAGGSSELRDDSMSSL